MNPYEALLVGGVVLFAFVATFLFILRKLRKVR